MKRGWVWSVTAGATVFWIVMLAPAQMLMWLLTDQELLLAQGYRGSLWSGSVDRAVIVLQGETLPLGRLDWHLRPGSLLVLSPCVEFSSNTRNRSTVQVIAGLACMKGGSVFLSDVNVSMPAELLLRSTDIVLDGQIDAVLNTLRWDGAALSGTQVRGLWSDASLSTESGLIALQSLPFELVQDGTNNLRLVINNMGVSASEGHPPPLHVDLISSIALDGSFQAQAILGLTESSPPLLRQWLPVIAEQRSDTDFFAQWRSRQI